MFTICKNSFIDEYKKALNGKNLVIEILMGLRISGSGQESKIVQSIGNRDDIPPIPVEGEQFKEIEEAEALERLSYVLANLLLKSKRLFS